MPFCNAKGHLLHIKRACFAMQKGTFYNAKEHRLKAGCDIILHKPRSISILFINFWVEIRIFLPLSEYYSSLPVTAIFPYFLSSSFASVGAEDASDSSSLCSLVT